MRKGCVSGTYISNGAFTRRDGRGGAIPVKCHLVRVAKLASVVIRTTWLDKTCARYYVPWSKNNATSLPLAERGNNKTRHPNLTTTHHLISNHFQITHLPRMHRLKEPLDRCKHSMPTPPPQNTHQPPGNRIPSRQLSIPSRSGSIPLEKPRHCMYASTVSETPRPTLGIAPTR